MKAQQCLEPLVSIITVVKNCDHAIRSTVESVLGQTYGRIEYIVIDGKSSDGTAAIVNEYGERIARIVSEADRGIYDAINKGVRLSSGDLICTLHAADRFAPQAIARMVAAAVVNRGAIVYTDYVYGNTPSAAPSQLSDAFYIYNMGVAHQSLMVPRDIYFTQVGLYDDELKIVSDHIWMRRAYERGVPFVHVPERLLMFDDNGLSSGQTSSSRELFEAEAALRLRQQFPFVPLEVARLVYRFRFSEEALDGILDWLTAQRSCVSQGDNKRMLQFRSAFAAYEDFARKRRILAQSQGLATHPGAL
jgi:glycosyltransferase involved in cell wall biosynthesis